MAQPLHSLNPLSLASRDLYVYLGRTANGGALTSDELSIVLSRAQALLAVRAPTAPRARTLRERMAHLPQAIEAAAEALELSEQEATFVSEMRPHAHRQTAVLAYQSLDALRDIARSFSPLIYPAEGVLADFAALSSPLSDVEFGKCSGHYGALFTAGEREIEHAEAFAEAVSRVVYSARMQRDDGPLHRHRLEKATKSLSAFEGLLILHKSGLLDAGEART